MLLNAILHEQLGYERIVEVELRPTENKGLSPERKSTRFDIHCTTDKGHQIVVEMQNLHNANFENRMFYYCAEGVKRQDVRDQTGRPWNFNIKPVVGIALCNFTGGVMGDRPLSYYTFREEKSGQKYGDQMSMVYLQLPKFTDDMKECNTSLEQIIYSMKNQETIQEMESIPFSKSDSDFFARLVRTSRYSASSPDEQLDYDRWLKHENDRLLELEETHRKGRAEGELKKAWESAKIMYKDNLPLNLISNYTGIPMQELIDNLN